MLINSVNPGWINDQQSTITVEMITVEMITVEVITVEMITVEVITVEVITSCVDPGGSIDSVDPGWINDQQSTIAVETITIEVINV